jgi:hypothetical protein
VNRPPDFFRSSVQWTVRERHPYRQPSRVQIRSSPERAASRAAAGSSFARAGQNWPRVFELHDERGGASPAATGGKANHTNGISSIASRAMFQNGTLLRKQFTAL